MPQAPAKLILLGNTGFIGKALFEHFRAYEEDSVLGYASSTLDLRNPKSLALLSDKVGPQTTLIVAAGMTIDRTQDCLDHFTANAEIGANVSRFLENHPVRKCVYFSTVSVYGDRETNLCVNEETLVQPTTHYASGKYAAECALQKAGQMAGFSVLVLRLCRIFGPGALHANYGPVRFIQSILEEGVVRIYGDGKESRDQLFLDDLVQMSDSLIRGSHFGTYNLATGRNHTFAEILESLQKMVPQKFRVEHLPRTRPLIDQQFDIQKLHRAVPGFRLTPFEISLKITYDFLSQNYSHRSAS